MGLSGVERDRGDKRPLDSEGESSGTDTKRRAVSSTEEPLEDQVEGIPRGIPKHGPGFLRLGREDREWLKRVHHRMGHPDPERFAKFLRDTHADSKFVSGALDLQCSSCAESSKGFAASRPAAIHDDVGFNSVVGLDVAVWTNSAGTRFAFLHCIDEGTLFQQARPCAGDAEAQFQAFEDMWLSWAGPPKAVYLDPARSTVAKCG